MILLEIKDAFSTSSYYYESLEDKQKKLTATWQKYISNDFYTNYSNYYDTYSELANYLNNSTRVYTTTYASNIIPISTMSEPSGNLYYMDYVCSTITNNI